jgi:hypothetical protein
MPSMAVSGTVVAATPSNVFITYAFRFGKRNVWKIGHSQDISARLVDVNKHVPHEVLGERCSVAWKQHWQTRMDAYEMEQLLLSALTLRRTRERVLCTEDELQAAWIDAIRHVRQSVAAT